MVLNRIADRIDLAIDVMTLGQYGLERVPAAAADCEGIGRRAGWETRAQRGRRRGACEPAVAMSWDWPRAGSGSGSVRG